MEYRHLGKSGLVISEIAYGNWITHGSQVEEQAAVECVRAALDEGITTFDTADVYARGRAEEVLGRALHGVRRESLEIFTKVYWPMGDSRNDRGLSRKHITESVHASLRRLQTDYIDLYQAHRYDNETPIEETMRAFDDLVRAGKVLYIGVSEWRAEQIAAALEVAGELGLDRIVSNQPQYNMLWRVIEAEVVPLCEKEGIGQVVFSPIAQGVLTGKYQPGAAPPADSRATDPSGSNFIKRFLEDETLTAVQRLKPLADEAGLSLAQLAVAWTLQNPNVSAAIIGATRPEQVRENVKASGVRLDPGLMQPDRRGARRLDHPRPGADRQPAVAPLIPGARSRGGRRRWGWPSPRVAVACWGWPSSVVRVQAHRAVFGPGVLHQRDLVHARRQQRAPVLAEPALRVALAGEDGLLQVIGFDCGAVRLLVPPGPGHGVMASLVVFAD